MNKWSIAGGTVLTPEKTIKNGSVTISNGRISKVTNGSGDAGASVSIDAGKGVVVPGLINAHDHLLGTYHPKIGHGPYINWLPWDNDLKSSPLYAERCQIENRDLYLLGAYRNLVSGVTRIRPHAAFRRRPVLRPPSDEGDQGVLAGSFDHVVRPACDGVTVEYEKAVKEDIPFVTHIGEGWDEETKQDIKVIDRLGGLGATRYSSTACRFPTRTDLVKKPGASCVWCGDSNMFMYNKTMDARAFLDKGINLCIGTDSSATGGENILYEMKFDQMVYERMYGEKLSDEQILKMVTVNPAKAFRQKKMGRIEEGCIADLCVFRDRGKSPANSVVHGHLRDVLLVVIDGMPVYGDAAYEDMFDALGVTYSRVVLDGADRIIIGDPEGLLRRISRAVGFKKEFPFLPIDFEI